MNISFAIRRLVGPLIVCCLFAISAFLVITNQTAHAQNANSTYTFQNGNTIVATGQGIAPDINGNRTRNFTNQNGTYLAAAQGELRPRATITNLRRVAGLPGTGEQTYFNATLTLFTVFGNQQTFEIRVQDPSNVGPTTPTTPEEEEEEEPDDCPIAKGTEFRWAMCPIFRMVNVFINVLDAFIHEYLSTGNAIFNRNQNDYRDAWQVFRNFAIGLLMIAGLVMLISEALSLSIVDAYTVRKVLPRLLIAIIGISLSWEFCRLLIGLFDDLGQAIGSIIYTSFNIPVTGINITEVITAWLLTGGAATAAALLLGGMGILSLLGTLVLAMLIGAVVLILRQSIIVAAVLLAPLAIAAYVLPNTSKFANFWWDTLFRMLMLYPIATGIIALCKVMGNITMNNPTNAGGTLGSIIALISGIVFFFAGYALIPLAFRLTGGLVATLGGIANDRSRGGFDRLKNFRKGKTEQNVTAMKTGTRFADRNPIARGFNRTSVGVGTGMKGRLGLGVRGREAIDQVRRNASADLKKTAGFQALQNDDDALMAATYNSETEARSALTRRFNGDEVRANRAAKAAKASIGFGRAQAIAAAEQLVATGTGYNDLEDMTATIARASGGHTGTATSIAGYANSATKQVGRHDLAPGFSNLNGLVQDTIRNGGALPDEDRFVNATIDAARGADNATLVRNKTPSIRNISESLRAGLRTAERNGDTARAAEIAFKIENMQQSGIYAPEQNIAALERHAAAPSVQAAIQASDLRTRENITRNTLVVNDQGEFETRQVTSANPEYDRRVDRISAQRQRRGYSQQGQGNDINDPRNPDLAA